MGFISPDIQDFKTYFFRDFPYGTTMDTVQDQDISNAFADASVNFSPGLFSSQASFTLCFLLLTAHFLVTNLRASSQGISGQYSWLQAGKGVGSVNESFAIPESIQSRPEFAMLSKTNYGAKYLFLILPQLIGQCFSVPGGTNP